MGAVVGLVAEWLHKPAQRWRIVFGDWEFAPALRGLVADEARQALTTLGLIPDDFVVPDDEGRLRVRLRVWSRRRPATYDQRPPTTPRSIGDEPPVVLQPLRAPRGGIAFAPSPTRDLAAQPEESRQVDGAVVLQLPPRIERVLSELVARRLAASRREAALKILTAYAEDLEERLAQEFTDVPVDLESPEVAGLRAALEAHRALPGWHSRPGQGYAATAPSWPVAASWQASGYQWRGRMRGAPCGFPGAFLRVEGPGDCALRFAAMVRGDRMEFLPAEWPGMEWCPSDEEGRLVGW